jgi:hypothetical protein
MLFRELKNGIKAEFYLESRKDSKSSWFRINKPF